MQTRKMVIIRGKGTKNETRIETDITMYWDNKRQVWFTIPTNDES